MAEETEEFSILSNAIGDAHARTVEALGWIGPSEREALVEAARRAQKSAVKARSGDMEQKMTATNGPDLAAMTAAINALTKTDTVASYYNPAVPAPEVNAEAAAEVEG